MKKIKNFIIGSSFVVLLSGSSIAYAATSPNTAGYSQPIKVSTVQNSTPPKKQSTKRIKAWEEGRQLTKHVLKMQYHKKNQHPEQRTN